MSESGSISTAETELRLSPWPVIASLGSVGWVLAFVSEFLPDSVRCAVAGMLLLAASGVAWVLVRRSPRAARWFIIAISVASVHLGVAWLRVPGLLALAMMPVLLTAALIGPLAATVTALIQALLALLLPLPGAAVLVPLLAAIAVALGLAYAIYRPVRQFSAWVEEYHQRTRELLTETQQRRATLEQTMADLAHANRQLALASERMAALREVAEQAQKAKTMFVAKVSHEFRTPLNMIIGLVGLMVETPEIYDVVLPPEMRDDLEIIHRNCVHLAGMINDVLDLTQMETGRLVLHRERVDLSEIIGSAVTSVRPLMDKKRLSLRVELPDSLPEVYCDRTRIQQVILNLVSNAARFTDQGGITVRLERRGPRVVVGVSDTGPGISAEDAERIFEPFCQGVSDLWRDKGGSGLGLAISKQFVELHGGRMWLESEVGSGATFFFELPISAPVEHMARPGHHIRADWLWRESAFRTDRAGLAEQLARPRLVVCDAIGSLTSRLADYADEIEAIEAPDLDQAVRELQECPAHAVVLNAAAPEELWPLVDRARRDIADTPIVGCAVPRPVQYAVEAGAVAYLTKPVTRADLEAALRSVGGPVRRVLVVDDDPDVLRLFTRMLRVCDEALSVTTALSGEQALEEVWAAPPDLVLLDVLMPGMDGWQVLERLHHQDGVSSCPPVILVSGQDPVDQPPESQLLLTTMDGGLSISKLLRCSLALSELLLRPGGRPGPGPRQAVAARPAWADSGRRREPAPGLLP